VREHTRAENEKPARETPLAPPSSTFSRMRFETPAGKASLERALAARAAPDGRLVAGIIASPVGALVAAAADEGLCLLEFGEEKRLASQLSILTRLFGPVRMGEHPLLSQTTAELAEYFAGERTRFDVPLVLRGTPFQELVWHALLTIPYGVTTAYSTVAESLGRPKAQRAVGLANGQNRVSIIVPCHRVIERKGGLRGYGGGLWRKRFLLDLERRTAGIDPLAGTPLGRTAG
jgi:O-6-methylguanine DNA methyltransferase